jgi:hypothetical protein
MVKNHLGITCCCVLASAGLYSTVHGQAEPRLVDSTAKPGLCAAGEKRVGTACVALSSTIHIDASPAFACLTSRGTIGNQLVEGVCRDTFSRPVARR